MMEILPRPASLEDRAAGPEIWVDEAIWGHRLYDEQTPWLTLLEFLGVLNAQHAEGKALREAQLNSLSYVPQTQLRLRNLLFNNPHMATVLASGLSDEGMWTDWLVKMAKGAGGLTDPSFAYLKEQFASFRDFDAVVSFLRSSAIEGDSNKRWSSKFVFPFGPDAFYEDLEVKANGGSTNDRRFFARSGELLYLMLCRSKAAEALRPLLIERFLASETPYNGLVAALQGETQRAQNARTGAYLPCATHTAFDRLGNDWLAILHLNMPVYDALPHLMAVTGLNILLYQLERAAELTGRAEPIAFVCEIVSPKRSVVRDLSADCFQENNVLPQQAIERFIRRTEQDPDWQRAAHSDGAGLAAAEFLEGRFDWPDVDSREGLLDQAPAKLLEELVAKANNRHKQHVGKVHATWARLIGLSSRRSSRRIRYAPTDRLLKTLVVACVDNRMEYKDFLDRLHGRYGLIVGHLQAARAIAAGAADQKDFEENARRLEERLASLGLLKRLSDSCAYVENPFQRKLSA